MVNLIALQPMTHQMMAHLDPEEIHGAKGHQSNVAWKVQVEYMVFGIKTYGNPVESEPGTYPAWSTGEHTIFNG